MDSSRVRPTVQRPPGTLSGFTLRRRAPAVFFHPQRDGGTSVPRQMTTACFVLLPFLYGFLDGCSSVLKMVLMRRLGTVWLKNCEDSL